ncbi:hypothetical protein QFC22_006204 [Naganishia vaughanmartiniae]|uniref:Uncharacterized protein n=1 Tax=Naganishia vaughanmartiniae TaxID=1424756 RepID=A0ACC2WM36_9TREE|nr:hypothetical protein QFC22_006204 [Naganishia vaughanmartiniae]
MPSVNSTRSHRQALQPLPNQSAVFSSRIVFTTLGTGDLPPATRAASLPSYPLVVRGRTVQVLLLETRYHHPEDSNTPLVVFCIDDVLTYSSFASDHGPLNICQIHYFASLLYSIFHILVEELPPWEVYPCLSEMSFIPFRDASQGEADHGLNMQDVMWGVWKAVQYGILSLEDDFDAEAYEWYEQPDNGDLNMLGPFIAFASPVDYSYLSRTNPTERIASSSQKSAAAERSFQDVLHHFEGVGVDVVVRLNEKLYDASVFEKRGMKHVEMQFPDGSNPPENFVRQFITLADQAIGNGGKVAVHCKAGLGRTGVLIGAYLIYKYGFTPNEVIAYMRIVRPGMVVGPQQAFMNRAFATWIRWSAVDEIKFTQRTTVFGTENTRHNQISEPKTRGFSPDLKENAARKTVTVIEQELLTITNTHEQHMPQIMMTPSRGQRMNDSAMAVTRTPGQPRKTPHGKTVVPADLDLMGEITGTPLSAKNKQTEAGPFAMTSPNKPKTRLQAIFDPPAETVAPQLLFTAAVVEPHATTTFTRKAPPESELSDRSAKRRAVNPERKATRTQSAVPIMTGYTPRRSTITSVSSTAAKSAHLSPSRIPMMMSSVKGMAKVQGKSQSFTCIQEERTLRFETPRKAEERLDVDVFGSPVMCNQAEQC